jgi:hypothetical protein
VLLLWQVTAGPYLREEERGPRVPLRLLVGHPATFSTIQRLDIVYLCLS